MLGSFLCHLLSISDDNFQHHSKACARSAFLPSFFRFCVEPLCMAVPIIVAGQFRLAVGLTWHLERRVRQRLEVLQVESQPLHFLPLSVRLRRSVRHYPHLKLASILLFQKKKIFRRILSFCTVSHMDISHSIHI